MPNAFVALAERIIDELLVVDPELAGNAGDHSADDRLPDLSAGGVAARVAMLRDASTALTSVDIDELELADRVDHEQLMALVDRCLFALTEVREHEWNPLVHNPGHLIHHLVARPFAPAEQRLVALRGRLAAVPDALVSARVALAASPRIHAEAAAGQFRGTATLIRDGVGTLLASVPSLTTDIAPVMADAMAALEDFATEIDRRLGDDHRGAADAREPRLGRRLWEAKLWHALDTDLRAADVLRLAWETVERVSVEIREEAARVVGGPATDDTVRRALALLGEQCPDDATIVDLAKATLAEATAFVAEHDLVSLVDDECLIQVMPEFERGVAVAECDAPGGLESAGIATSYRIAPAPKHWSAARVASFYREYNNDMIRDLTVHEAMPGHYLQLAHARRYRGRTRVRALTGSGTFVEGWAVYAERLMAEHGFGGPRVRLVQLKMQLRMAVNAILDHMVHCADLAETEAMSLMMERAFQEEGEAAGKWRRSLLTSTQLSTYLVGYLELAAIAARRPAGVTPRAWHDGMLAHGSPAPRHLATLLGVAPLDVAAG